MKTLNRTLLLLVTVLLSLCFTGGRCYAEDVPRMICHTHHFVSFVLTQSRMEKPAPFFAKGDNLARRAVVPVIFPESPVPTAYHPQPAHC